MKSTIKRAIIFLILMTFAILPFIFDGFVYSKQYGNFFSALCFIGALRVLIGRDIFENLKFTKESGEIRYGSKGNKLPEYEEIENFRDIPLNGNIFMSYWVCLKYNIVHEVELKEGLMGAIFLKWLKEKRIKIVKTKMGLLSFSDNNYAVDLRELKNLDNPAEKYFCRLLMSIAGRNRILEANEFQKWCYYNYGKLDGWFFYARYIGQKQLEEAKFINPSVEKIMSNNRKKKTIVINNVSDDLWYEALKLKGLKKFLLYFTLMDEKEYLNVHLWDDYLIFSSLLNVSRKIDEQFKKIYPQLNGTQSLDINIFNYGLGLAELGYMSSEKGLKEQESSTSSEKQKDYKNQ